MAQCLCSNNLENPVSVVLAGFFLAVLTMVGYFDSALASLSSEALKIYWDTYTNKLFRQAVGVLFFLITVIVALIVEFFPAWDIPRYAFVFMTVASLFWALSFPYTLYIFYKERYEYMIRQKTS